MKFKNIVLSSFFSFFLLHSFLSAKGITNNILLSSSSNSAIFVSKQVQSTSNSLISSNILTQTVNNQYLTNDFISFLSIKVKDLLIKAIINNVLIFISFIILIILMLLLRISPNKNQKLLTLILSTLIGILFISFLFFLILLLSLGEILISFILLVIIISYYLLSAEMAGNSVIINSFSVPDAFLKENEGYTGQVFAWHIIDEINKITNPVGKFEKEKLSSYSLKEEMSSPIFAPNQHSDDISISVGKVAFSIGTVIRYLKKSGCLKWLFNGKYYIVDGDIIKRSPGNKWFLSIRVREKNTIISENFRN